MTLRGAGPRLLAGAMSLLCGCAPALRQPPPVAAIASQPDQPPAPALAPAEVDRALAEADADFGRRPDMGAVSRAYGTFLAAARADEARVEGLLGAAKAAAWIIEHDADERRRSRIATEAVQVCQWCMQRAPENVVCRYRLALALGQQARERRTTAKDGLSKMIGLLEEVIAADPRLDNAGGHRVLALVLLRAPGWPAGPGDPEVALEHARAADQLAPASADNLLVLGEALADNGDAPEARAACTRAAQIARARQAEGDPDAAELIAAARRIIERLPR